MTTTPHSPRRRLRSAVIGGLLVGALGVPSIVSAGPVLSPTPMERASISGLRQGASGPDVAALQQALISAGVTVLGGADGVFGPATRAAVVAFQEKHGLAATGEVDAATADKLQGGSAGASSGSVSVGTSTLTSGFVGMAEGTTGDAVKQVQQALMDIGVFVPGGADGVFGAATTKALIQFQRWNGLEVTGTVTEPTARLLRLNEGAAAGSGGSATTTASAQQTTASSSYVGLSIGATGDRVRELQSALVAAGVTVLGGADGSFGPATQGALKAFQWRSGRPQTGAVTAEDASELGLGSGSGGSVASDAGTGSSGNPYVGLTVGDEGPLVTEVQKALQGFGFVIRGGANGVFGPSTKSTLMAFQSVNGIARTGVVTEKGAKIMKLGQSTESGSGSGSGPSGVAGGSGGSDAASVSLERFPVQGLCFFGDTWHAPRSNGRLHEGVDIIAKEGQLLYAVTDGEITKQYWDYPGALSGNGVRLTTDDGTYFTYLHLLDVAPGIEVGTKVEAGDVIGFVGNTGSSATAHLHFEIHPKGGAAINPYPYVKAIDDCKNTEAQYQQSFPGAAPAAVSAEQAATAEIGVSD